VILGRVVVACTYGVPLPRGGFGPSTRPESQAGQALPCIYPRVATGKISSLLQRPG
jgi:hypothetical protein